MDFPRPNDNANKKEIEAHFNFFIENISKHLVIAKQWLKKGSLDFSFKEIDAIQDYYTKEFKKRGKKPSEWYEENHEVFTTYIGEAFKSYLLGEYKINDTKGTDGYGYPFLFNIGSEESIHNPLDLSGYVNAIESGYKIKISEIIGRFLIFYKNSPEYNFEPLENLRINVEKINNLLNQ